MPAYTDKQISAVLLECKGMVYVAAARLGCSPNTIKSRLARSEKLRAALDTAQGTTTDTAELKLFQSIQNGEPWAIQFYLKTIGKRRGYVERIESYTYDLSHATDEQLDRIAAGEDPAHVLSDTGRSGAGETPPLTSQRIN